LTGIPGVSPRTVPREISEASQKATESFSVAMNITNNVEHPCNWTRSAGEFQA
jgi:hypothetical protein